MSSMSPGVLDSTQRRSSPRRRASSQSSMPRSRFSAIHASVRFVAGQGASGWPVVSLITAVRTPLILLMAVGQSPARSAISASTSRISRPVERLIGEFRPVYFVGKSQGTYRNSAVGTAGFVLHATRGSPVSLKYCSLDVPERMISRYGWLALTEEVVVVLVLDAVDRLKDEIRGDGRGVGRGAGIVAEHQPHRCARSGRGGAYPRVARRAGDGDRLRERTLRTAEVILVVGRRAPVDDRLAHVLAEQPVGVT